MPAILCPHCQAQLNFEQHQHATTVRCLSCGQQLAIPAQEGPLAEPTETSAVVISTRSQTTPRRRKKARGNRVITALFHLSITAATIYAGYSLITQRRPKVEPKPIVVVEPPPQSNRAPQSSPIGQAPLEPPAALRSEPTVEPAPTIEVTAQPISPFAGEPTEVDLPRSDDLKIVTLTKELKATDRVALVSNTSALKHAGKKILWQDGSQASVAVAGLAVHEGALVFRWLAAVPQAAESAIRNSIVRLESGEFRHVFALRHPQSSPPLVIDLNQRQQRILSKCDFLPALEDLCFALSGLEQLPAASIAGADPSRLQIRDQILLKYANAAGAATRFTLERRGNLIAVELESRYVLPSGEKQSMTIEHGNKKLNALVALHQEAQGATESLTNLRRQLKSWQSEARAVPRSRATATAKSARLRELQNSVVATQRKIQYAEQLIQQQEAIAADHEAIQQIAQLAQQLHETELAYRFYTVVDGHEVDVLVAQ